MAAIPGRPHLSNPCILPTQGLPATLWAKIETHQHFGKNIWQEHMTTWVPGGPGARALSGSAGGAASSSQATRCAATRGSSCASWHARAASAAASSAAAAPPPPASGPATAASSLASPARPPPDAHAHVDARIATEEHPHLHSPPPVYSHPCAAMGRCMRLTAVYVVLHVLWFLHSRAITVAAHE